MISNKLYSLYNLKNLNRPRLNNIIDRCMNYPLIMFEAGSGFGKSTAIQQYMECREINYTSLLLSELDNLPEQFWMKFSKSFLEIDKELSSSLEDMGFPFSSSEIIDCLKLIRTHLAKQGGFCLIIDCFDLLTDPTILTFIEQIITAEIDHYHIILTSINRISMNTDNLTIAGLTASITTDDLCFTKQEIVEYFRILDLDTASDTIKWVYDFSEGWPFAVKLLAFSLINSPDKKLIEKKVMPTFYDLMDTFTFKYYPQGWQNLLVTSSHLGKTIPIPLIMSITGLTYDAIITMTENNPFIRYDSAASSLDVHNIYLKFLCTRQMYASDQGNNKLYRKIGDWYSKNDSPYEAIQYFNKCSYHEGICRIIRKMKNRKFSSDMADFLLDSIHQLPSEIISEFPDIPLYEALLLFNNWLLKDAGYLLNIFESSLLQAETNEQNQTLLGEAYCIHGLINMFLRKTDYVEYFKRSSELLPQGSRILNYQYPFMEIHPGLLSYSLSKEDIETTITLIDKGFPYFTRITRGCGAGFTALSHGNYEFLKNNLSMAEKHFKEAVSLAEEYLQADTVLISYFMLLRINIARGYPRKALEYLEKIDSFPSRAGYPKRNYPIIDIAKAWVAIKVGTGKGIAQWLLSDDLAVNGISRRSDGRNLTLYANWLLTIKHSPVKALVYINQIEHIFRYYGLHSTVVHTHLLRYSAYKALGRSSEECYQIIETIYEMIKDADLTMFVIEHGTISRTALIAYKKYQKRKIPDSWIEHVLKKSTTYNKYLNAFKQEYWKSTKETPFIQLTASEMSLLDCMCSGLSRAEIAEEHGISENTVKSQLRTIYYKLNATNQAEAVYLYTSMKLAESNK